MATYNKIKNTSTNVGKLEYCNIKNKIGVKNIILSKQAAKKNLYS